MRPGGDEWFVMGDVEATVMRKAGRSRANADVRSVGTRQWCVEDRCQSRETIAKFASGGFGDGRRRKEGVQWRIESMKSMVRQFKKGCGEN
jgi:hypothetical protein